MEVGAFEAKTNLSKLLERVAQGEEVTITKHGRPIALLIPATPRHPPKPNMATVIDQIHQARVGVTLGGIPIRELIETGRRF